jgi:hypothetical protein
MIRKYFSFDKPVPKFSDIHSDKAAKVISTPNPMFQARKIGGRFVLQQMVHKALEAQRNKKITLDGKTEIDLHPVSDDSVDDSVENANAKKHRIYSLFGSTPAAKSLRPNSKPIYIKESVILKALEDLLVRQKAKRKKITKLPIDYNKSGEFPESTMLHESVETRMSNCKKYLQLLNEIETPRASHRAKMIVEVHKDILEQRNLMTFLERDDLTESDLMTEGLVGSIVKGASSMIGHRLAGAAMGAFGIKSSDVNRFTRAFKISAPRNKPAKSPMGITLPKHKSLKPSDAEDPMSSIGLARHQKQTRSKPTMDQDPMTRVLPGQRHQALGHIRVTGDPESQRIHPLTTTGARRYGGIDRGEPNKHPLSNIPMMKKKKYLREIVGDAPAKKMVASSFNPNNEAATPPTKFKELFQELMVEKIEGIVVEKLAKHYGQPAVLVGFDVVMN